MLFLGFFWRGHPCGERGGKKIPPTPDCAFCLTLDIDLAKLLKCPGYGKAEKRPQQASDDEGPG